MNLIVEEPRNPSGPDARNPSFAGPGREPDLDGKRVLVIGLGATGVSASRFLAARGARVSVQDDAPPAMLAPALREAEPFVEESRLGGSTWSDLRGFDLIVPSPGVPREAPLLRAAGKAGIRIWSEIELAFRFLRIPLIAVTGSNGKSTTTSLIGAMLAADGRKGRRPSFDRAASPEDAEALYGCFCERMVALGVPTETGTFGAMMEVELINDGPVTFLLEESR